MSENRAICKAARGELSPAVVFNGVTITDSTHPSVLADASAIDAAAPTRPGAATISVKAAGITLNLGAVVGHRLLVDRGSEVAIGEFSVTGCE